MEPKNKVTTIESRENTFTAPLKEQIKNHIKALGLNVRTLEKKAGLSAGTMANIMHRPVANPTAETLIALANAFECGIDELLGRKVLNNHKVEIKLESGDDSIWNSSLYLSIVEELYQQLNETKVTITTKNAHYIIYEIYQYSNKKDKETVDKSLVEWFIDKYK